MHGTLANIVQCLAPFWADPARATTSEGLKALHFLLDIISCVCVLPPESEPVLPDIDQCLLQSIGVLCANDPMLCGRYPEVGQGAVRAMLEDQTLFSLCLLARDNDVDIDCCKSTAQVIEALLDSRQTLIPLDPAVPARSTFKSPPAWDVGELAHEMGIDITPCRTTSEVVETLVVSGKALGSDKPTSPMQTRLERKTLLDLFRLAVEIGVDVTPCVWKPQVVRRLLASGKDLEQDRAALMALFTATGGLSWKNVSSWGTSNVLETWNGVTVGVDGRVTKLNLQCNELTGMLGFGGLVHFLDRLALLRAVSIGGRKSSDTSLALCLRELYLLP